MRPGVVAVSMSWGGSEFSGETSYDSYFTTPGGHNGVTFVASSGDSGAPASYPAASPNVVSVGGTSLYAQRRQLRQRVGVERQRRRPEQRRGPARLPEGRRHAIVPPSAPRPTCPTTPTPTPAFRCTIPTRQSAPWGAIRRHQRRGPAVGGAGGALPTKAVLPMAWLARRPVADLAPAVLDAGRPTSTTSPAGSSTGSPQLSAGPGYDLVTGRGTPMANLLIPALAGGTIAPPATHFSITTSPTSSTAGQSVNVTVTALDGNNNVFTGYTGIVQLTSSDAAATPAAAHT